MCYLSPLLPALNLQMQICCFLQNLVKMKYMNVTNGYGIHLWSLDFSLSLLPERHHSCLLYPDLTLE